MTCDLTFRYPIAAKWLIPNCGINQIAYLRGKRYENEKKLITNISGINQHKKEVEAQVGQQPKNNTTAKMIGDEYNVGYNTVRRAEHFAKTVDILPEEAKQKVLKGEVKITGDEANTISKMDIPTQKKFIKEVEKGTPNK